MNAFQADADGVQDVGNDSSCSNGGESTAGLQTVVFQKEKKGVGVLNGSNNS